MAIHLFALACALLLEQSTSLPMQQSAFDEPEILSRSKRNLEASVTIVGLATMFYTVCASNVGEGRPIRRPTHITACELFKTVRLVL